jgi:serine protease AprX
MNIAARNLKIFSLLLIAGVLSLLVAVVAPRDTEPSVHPSLLQIAQQTPTLPVAILVQQRTIDLHLQEIVTEQGGTITRDLPIVKGFAAQVPAGLIPALGREPSVRWISPDSLVRSAACAGCYTASKLASPYPRAVGADIVWNRSTQILGRGIGVAIIDSGVNDQGDLYLRNTGTNRLTARVAYNAGYNTSSFDAYGHGNHVAGIVGGNGSRSNSAYVGIAPEVNIINVKVSDDQNSGVASTSSIVAGMQWVYNNRLTYNIRVVNISMTDSVVESYHVSALSAAAELLWFNNIVVVVAAGNSGTGALAAPANDPFVITVGAIDDHGTPQITDDTVPAWSASGTTIDGFKKPDLVAPGTNLVSLMPGEQSILSNTYPQNIVTSATGVKYFRMSGTSMSAPVVTGAVALLLQDEPRLTPDQVKQRLLMTARPFGDRSRTGAGYLYIPAMIDGTSTASANTGIQISRILQDGTNPTTWNSANWSTAKWSTAKWSTAKWSTAKWSTAR